jgi:hypothetical protein
MKTTNESVYSQKAQTKKANQEQFCVFSYLDLPYHNRRCQRQQEIRDNSKCCEYVSQLEQLTSLEGARDTNLNVVRNPKLRDSEDAFSLESMVPERLDWRAAAKDQAHVDKAGDDVHANKDAEDPSPYDWNSDSHKEEAQG